MISKKNTSFKDFVASDITDVFFNTEEFADEFAIKIADTSVTVMFDTALLREHNASIHDGISAGEYAFFVPVSVCEERTVFEGAIVTYKGKRHEIVSVSEVSGVYQIVLGVSV